MRFFDSDSAPPSETFFMCLKAAATGDMLFMLILYLTVTIIHQKFWWLSAPNVYSHPATWVIPILVGVLLAISLELFIELIYGKPLADEVRRWKAEPPL